jgi:[protein-PII] uridylyltransferase
MGSSGASDSKRLLSAEGADRLIAERSEKIDAVVQSSFSRHLAPAFPQGLAALAVGGFGRRELFPCSDVDVLVLMRDGLRASAVREPLGRFLQELWDAGLRLSHSVHTIEECCQIYEHNVELSVSLLDQRPLIGDASLLEQMETALAAFFRIHGRAVARRLATLTRFRHAKFNNSIFHLEPNIKDAPGALRDLQVIHWLARLLPGGIPADLEAAWRFLAPLRVFLHESSRRDDNLLSFEMQDAIAGQPAEMMRSYYRHARAMFSSANSLLEAAEESQPSLIRQFRDWRSRLSNSEFTVSRDRVFLRSPGQLATDPGIVFRLLEFIAHHGVVVSQDVERRLTAAAPELARTLAKLPFWPHLKAVLSQSKASIAIRLMQSTGLMSALLPEWANIDCLVVRDFYHRYTVDEHTIVAIETLETLPDNRFRDLLVEVPDVALLRFALLLHDVGKGSGRDHTGESARLATQVGRRIGIPLNELDIVRLLIAQHLELSSTMNTRDLDDAQTARKLAGTVGTVEQLKMLTLLTYADIGGVNPSAMTPWRCDQLWRAYLAGYAELTTELDTVRIHNFEGAGAETAEFVEGLPNRYLRTHSLERIQAHAALAAGAAQNGVAAELVRNNGYWQVVVAAKDHPFLFASIAGTLAAFGMNILKAEAFANARGIILDTFTFADPLRTLELNPTEVDRLRDTFARVVLGKTDVKRLLASRRPGTRRPSRVEPRVAFNNKASQSATLIELIAEDRPGLLYDLASTMSGAGCDIVVVLIDTEANKALDVFYVTAEGKKLDGEREEKLRRELLTVCGAE